MRLLSMTIPTTCKLSHLLHNSWACLLTIHRAPYSKPEEVWGVENFNRLVAIKEKYDPQCLMSRGVVIPTKACQSKGLVNYSLGN